jgi:16S rRNA G966 N2-methylase RsmD
MARLASQARMGYYPTPSATLERITTKLNTLHGDGLATILDPCCGKGEALSEIHNALGYYSASSYGIELDTERARDAHRYGGNVLAGSIYDAVIRPAGSFSLLYLNPPYDFEKGERMEFLFLKRSHNWLADGGLLIFLVPEHILGVERISRWIARRYTHIRVYRFTREDYPVFKQVVLFGVKKKEEETADYSKMPLSYPHIEDTQGDATYSIPCVQHPKIFELEGMTEEEIAARREESIGDVKNALLGPMETNSKILSPIFPLRKGHLLSILMSGVLNGKLSEDIYFKCYTQRCKTVREEVDEKENSKIITTDSHQSGIRVIERGNWYDVA